MANFSAGRLLDGLDGLLADVAAGRRLARHGWGLGLRMAACAALYGAVFGSWQGARLAAYVALKLPLVLLLTSALTLVFSWLAARLLGLPLRFGQVAVLTFLGLAVASLLLASLSPAAWLFIHCAPPPTTDARTAHNLLYLMHTLFVGWRFLSRALLACGAKGGLFLWLLLFLLVSFQVTTFLRPVLWRAPGTPLFQSQEKMSFFEHLGRVFDEDQQRETERRKAAEKR